MIEVMDSSFTNRPAREPACNSKLPIHIFRKRKTTARLGAKTVEQEVYFGHVFVFACRRIAIRVASLPLSYTYALQKLSTFDGVRAPSK